MRKTTSRKTYHKTFSISRTKSRSLNISRLVVVFAWSVEARCREWSREWRCSCISADKRCSNYSWVINMFIAYKGAANIRGLMVRVPYKRPWEPMKFSSPISDNMHNIHKITYIMISAHQHCNDIQFQSLTKLMQDTIQHMLHKLRVFWSDDY